MWGAIIASVISTIAAMVMANQQEKSNIELADHQNAMNQNFLAQQNEYNTPASQIRRFQSAGLNPNLIYGQGSPGNQSASLSYPDVRPTDLGGITQQISNAYPQIQQARLVDSQINAQNAATRQKYAQTELTKLQAQVLEKNPALDDAGYKAMIDGLKAAAELKKEQVRSTSIKNFVDDSTAVDRIVKVWNEVKQLDQRFELNKLDLKLKAEVLKSKEFQNAVLEVQKKFMTDGDITPQHILQFVQLLLMKSL